MKRFVVLLETFTVVNILSGVIKYGLFVLTHPFVGPYLANAISVILSTLFQYFGYKHITWKDRSTKYSFVKFLGLEIPITIAEISIFPVWLKLPVWEKVLNFVGIYSVLLNGVLALYVFGFAMWLTGIFYHNFITFRDRSWGNKKHKKEVHMRIFVSIIVLFILVYWFRYEINEMIWELIELMDKKPWVRVLVNVVLISIIALCLYVFVFYIYK